MSKETTRTILLETGKLLFLARGYSSTGIEAVVQAAGVTKGSFYYYFGSKEEFGLQVLDRFAEEVRANFERCLGDTSVSPIGRFRRYFEEVCLRLESQECRTGCLVGNLSQEMAAQSEAFRSRLEEIFEGIMDRYVEGLKVAEEAGEIPPGQDLRALAEFCLSSWQGAILRAKSARSTRPIRTFIDVVFGSLLTMPEKTVIGSET
jgi:TetR/AcrR family transcriptional regulator, transcriptional repressor for nem operon